MRHVIDRVGWVFAGVLAMLVISLAAREVAGGPLDPPGAPTSTMQTLDNIPGSWDRNLSSTNGSGNGCDSDRFKCVLLRVTCNPNCIFFYDGVLDEETGLVWARDVTGAGTGMVWSTAVSACLDYDGGDLEGWRLPTAAELLSLLDPTRVNPTVSVPASSPFLHLQNATLFWTATDDAANSSNAYVVQFMGLISGVPGQREAFLKTGSTIGAWCVRGADTQ
jgi:hypothetical protein